MGLRDGSRRGGAGRPARFASTTLANWTAPVAWSVSIMGRLGWMKDSAHIAGPHHRAAGHADHVYSVAEGATPPPGIEEISSSWQRSANKHGVDPDDGKAPRILTPGELKNFRGPLEKLIFTATTGRSGTLSLAKLFAKVPGCRSVHEGHPVMNG